MDRIRGKATDESLMATRSLRGAFSRIRSMKAPRAAWAPERLVNKSRRVEFQMTAFIRVHLRLALRLSVPYVKECWTHYTSGPGRVKEECQEEHSGLPDFLGREDPDAGVRKRTALRMPGRFYTVFARL